MNVAANLDLSGTYVTQQVSSNIECNDPLTEQRDYAQEVRDSLDELNSLSVNERSANIWWGGESKDVRALKYQKREADGKSVFDIAVDGAEALVFKSENHNGKLVRFWIDKNTNVTARIRHSNTPTYGPAWHLEVYVNRKLNRNAQNSKWSGQKIADHFVHRTVTDESELTISKYVAIYFARFAN